MKNALKVVGMPDRLKIAYALMEGNRAQQIPLMFTLQDNGRLWTEYVKVDKVEREDGSGFRFNLYGANSNLEKKVQIFIDLSNRSGSLTFLSKSTVIQVMLRTANYEDDALKMAEVVREYSEVPGCSKSCDVIICQGQGVAYDGQVLHATFNSAENRWEVDHPCC